MPLKRRVLVEVLFNPGVKGQEVGVGEEFEVAVDMRTLVLCWKSRSPSLYMTASKCVVFVTGDI